jgi:hypothetical protein
MDSLSITDILQQAQALTPQERKELVKLLVDSLEVSEPASHARTGKEIAAMLAAMEPIEMVDQAAD